MAETLPGIATSWTASALDDEDFQHYNIKRRVNGSGDVYVTVARLTDKATDDFTDYTAKSGVAYDYAISQVTPLGEEAVIATDTNNTVTFSNTFLHDANAGVNGEAVTYCAFVRGPFNINIADEREVERLLPFNSQKPVVHLGVALYRTAVISYLWTYKVIDSENEAKVQLGFLNDLLESGQTLCLRTGTGELMYCQIEASSHGVQAPFLVTPSLSLVEVNWEENRELVE